MTKYGGSSVRVRIYICVLDDGDWYAGGWPHKKNNLQAGTDLYGDLKECVREWAFDKENEQNRAHYFWVEVDIKIRQDGNIVVTPEQNPNPKEKYTPSQVAAALTKVPK